MQFLDHLCGYPLAYIKVLTFPPSMSEISSIWSKSAPYLTTYSTRAIKKWVLVSKKVWTKQIILRRYFQFYCQYHWNYYLGETDAQTLLMVVGKTLIIFKEEHCWYYLLFQKKKSITFFKGYISEEWQKWLKEVYPEQIPSRI